MEALLLDFRHTSSLSYHTQNLKHAQALFYPIRPTLTDSTDTLTCSKPWAY